MRQLVWHVTFGLLCALCRIWWPNEATAARLRSQQLAQSEEEADLGIGAGTGIGVEVDGDSDEGGDFDNENDNDGDGRGRAEGARHGAFEMVTTLGRRRLSTDLNGAADRIAAEASRKLPGPVAKALGATRTPGATGMHNDSNGDNFGDGADGAAVGRPRSGSRDTGGSQQGTMLLSRIAGRPTAHIGHAHARARASTAPAEHSGVFFDDDNSNSDPDSDEEVTL